MVINKTKITKLIYFLIFFNLFFGILTTFGLPSILRYINDIVWAIMLIWMIPNFKSFFKRSRNQATIYLIGFFALICMITAMVNLVKPQLVLWSSRNIFRFFIVYIATVFCLTIEDIDQILNMLFKIQWVNIIITLYQYFILGLEQDVLGGIFGSEAGCNAGTNIYFCILLIFVLIRYINKQASILKLAFIIISTMGIAALAELKVYYVEFVMIVGMVVLLSKPNRKVITIMLSCVLGLFVGLAILKEVFPGHYVVLINLANFKDYATMQGGGYNISRFGAFSEINDLFFHDNVFYNLFGFGFGNCEYAAYDFFVSDFYRIYGQYNYRWFTHHMIFLQTRYSGMIAYLMIFISMGLNAFVWKPQKSQHSTYRIFSVTLIAVSIVNIFYNSLFMIEHAYFIFPLLAIVPILKNQKLSTNALLNPK